ncbi:Uncharacterised protein [Bordetella pertussis]|nr:Uncharacterised protein [Bordetella pertussis]
MPRLAPVMKATFPSSAAMASSICVVINTYIMKAGHPVCQYPGDSGPHG